MLIWGLKTSKFDKDLVDNKKVKYKEIGMFVVDYEFNNQYLTKSHS